MTQPLHLRMLALVCSNELHQLPRGLDPEWAHKLYNAVLRAVQLLPGTPPDDFLATMPELVAVCWGLSDYSADHERFYREIVARVYERADVFPRSLNDREKQDIRWAHGDLVLTATNDHWESIAAFAPGVSAEAARRHVLATERMRRRRHDEYDLEYKDRKRRREHDEEEKRDYKRRRRRDDDMTLSSL